MLGWWSILIQIRYYRIEILKLIPLEPMFLLLLILLLFLVNIELVSSVCIIIEFIAIGFPIIIIATLILYELIINIHSFIHIVNLLHLQSATLSHLLLLLKLHLRSHHYILLLNWKELLLNTLGRHIPVLVLLGKVSSVGCF